MKIKSYFLLIIVINIFMVACSNNQNMLVGKWKLVNTSSPQRMNKSLEKGLMWEFCEEGSILYMTDAGIADKDNTVGEMEMIKLTENNLTVRISNGNDWIDLMFQKMIE